MEYRIEMSGDTATVVMSGDITFTQNVRFRALMKDLAAVSFSRAKFDVTRVTKLDSTGLGMFLIAHENAQNQGWSLQITGAQPQVASTLKLAALTDIMTN